VRLSLFSFPEKPILYLDILSGLGLLLWKRNVQSAKKSIPLSMLNRSIVVMLALRRAANGSRWLSLSKFSFFVSVNQSILYELLFR
jgi:hypothetical protein